MKTTKIVILVCLCLVLGSLASACAGADVTRMVFPERPRLAYTKAEITAWKADPARQKEIQQIVETMGVSKGSVKIGFQSDYLLNSQQMLPDWDIPETLGQFHEYYRNNTGFYPTLLIITAKRFSPPRFQIHARYQSPRKNMVPNHRFFTDRYKLHRVIVI